MDHAERVQEQAQHRYKIYGSVPLSCEKIVVSVITYTSNGNDV